MKVGLPELLTPCDLDGKEIYEIRCEDDQVDAYYLEMYTIYRNDLYSTSQ